MSIHHLPESTSPEKPAEFDAKEPAAWVLCCSCKQPLWEIEVYTKAGKVVSSSHRPIGRNKEFMGKSFDCPLCGNRFDKEGKFLYRSLISKRDFLS
jgi:hypothetical protein